MTEGLQSLIEHGISLMAAGNVHEALAAFTRALQMAPNDATLHMRRGFALKMLLRLDESAQSFQRAVELEPNSVTALVNSAAISQQLGRCREALAASERAISIAPQFAPAHCNRGLALSDLDRPLEALHSYDVAIRMDPNFAAAHGNRGKVLQILDRHEEALLAYERVVELQPTAAQAYLNASHAHLLLGDFDPGWKLYEWRKRLAQPLGNRAFSQDEWSGTVPLQGRRLLLHCEQGLGDTLQFCRYALLAKAGGADVTLLAPSNLHQLLRTLDPQIAVASLDAIPTDIDCHCAMLSAPRAFGTQLATIPAQTPYLAAEPDRIARWRSHIGSQGFKIGINWQGNTQSPADRGRSFSPALFQEIAALPGVRLINLQFGQCLPALPGEMRIESPGAAVDADGNAFVDTAAIMQCLDLVITSDTAIAHLAGALNRPTWVVLQQVPDWRWMRIRNDSPWYPSLRLFRQSQRGDWSDPFAKISAALATLRSSC